MGDLAAFRAAYRASISPRYAPRLHAAFVFAAGLGFATWRVVGLRAGAPALLGLVAGLVVFNVGVYAVHRGLGHTKTRLGRAFYRRHTVEHHQFFLAEAMAYEDLRDLRVVLFPPWLLVVVALIALGLGALAAALAGLVLTPATAAAAGDALAAGVVLGYLLYELFHLSHHLPDDHPLPRLPWFRHARQLHRLHHRPGLMREANFNIVLPLTDLVLGTLRWEPIEPPPSRDT
jgi:hypothetical protein